MEKIYWEKAIELLKNGGNVEQQDIDFREEQIPVKDVSFLNQNKIRVPENLIFYDDDNIDCSDIPEITDEDIEKGKIQWIKTEEFHLDNEVRNWIVKQNIKLNELIPRLIHNFYDTVKHLKNNAAL